MNRFRMGVLTARDADALNDLARQVELLSKLTVSQPLTISQPGGIKTISMDGPPVTSWKTVVRAATTVNGTLASAYEAGDTLDGVTLAAGDRILLKNQTAGAENGIYLVQASGLPLRVIDANDADKLVGATVFVSGGTANKDTFWVCTTDAPIVLDTTSLTWVQFPPSSSWKNVVRCASTSNGTLSSAYTNGSVVDGVTLVTGDRILLKDQSSASENGIYCLDESTEILTRQGWKFHHEVKEDDEALTLNISTGLSEWQPILGVHAFPVVDTEMLSLEMKTHSSLSTMNHRWPVRRLRWDARGKKHGSPYLSIKESRDLNSSDAIVQAAPCADLPSIPTYSDAFVELVAWFVTEGHIRRNKSGSLSNVVRIVQSAKVNDPYVSRIRDRLRDIAGEPTLVQRRRRGGVWKPEWRERPNSNGCGLTTFELNSVFGKTLCDVAPDRVAKASFINSLTASQLRIFIDTFISADGCISKTGQRVAIQKSLDRFAPLQMACTLLGIPTNTSVHSTASGCWSMGLNNQRTIKATHSKKNRVVRYTGTVWCPRTQNGTWFARRNGTVYATGNTVKSGGSPSRASDASAVDSLVGAVTWVSEGTVNADSIWACTTDATITVGTTATAWVKVYPSSSDSSWKQPVRVRSTATVTVGNPGTSTFDSVTLSTGDRVLLMNQSSTAQNGIYLFNGSSSAMTRTGDCDAASEFIGATTYVREGTLFAKTIWTCVTPPAVVGTNSNLWEEVPHKWFTKKTIRKTGTTTVEPCITLDPDAPFTSARLTLEGEFGNANKPTCTLAAGGVGATGDWTQPDTTGFDGQSVSVSVGTGGPPDIVYVASTGISHGYNAGHLAYQLGDPLGIGANFPFLAFNYGGYPYAGSSPQDIFHSPIINGIDIIAGHNGSPTGGFSMAISGVVYSGATGTMVDGTKVKGGIITTIGGAAASIPMPLVTDAAATNNSLYYSVTIAKLAYKDIAGVVWPLY